MTDKLKNKYETIAKFMTSNRLKVNGDKTHLMVMMPDQARRLKPDFSIQIEIDNEIIETSENEKMLGGLNI